MIIDTIKTFLGARCIICHEKTQYLRSNLLCFKCFRASFLAPTKRCKFCGITSELTICPLCTNNPLFKGGIKVLFDWNPELDSLIKLYKHHYNFRVLKLFQQNYLRKSITQGVENNFDYITTLPSSRKRTLKRGFDHTYYLASAIFGDQKLIKLFDLKVNTKPQAILTPQQRWQNYKNALTCRYNLDKNSKVLIIDDIITTATSLYFANKLLDCNVSCVAITASPNYVLKRRFEIEKRIKFG